MPTKVIRNEYCKTCGTTTKQEIIGNAKLQWYCMKCGTLQGPVLLKQDKILHRKYALGQK